MIFKIDSFQLLVLASVILLSIAAERCRLLIGEGATLKSLTGRFTVINCFERGTGTIACIVKEIVKVHLHYISAVHLRRVRSEATTEALNEGLSQGLSYEEASKQALEEGDAAARRRLLQFKHIMGHLITSGWDVFETLYAGGTMAEGFIRGGGALLGSYAGGYIGEQRLGWIGFLVGSEMGSLAGGRIGLVAYDVGNAVQNLLELVGKEHSWGSFL